MRPGILIALLLQVHRGQPSQFAVQLMTNSDSTKFWFVQFSQPSETSMLQNWQFHGCLMATHVIISKNDGSYPFACHWGLETSRPLYGLQRWTAGPDGPVFCFETASVVWTPPSERSVKRDFVVRRTEHHLIKKHYISAVKQKQCLS